MPQTGTGFVNLSNYLDANHDALQNEATNLINVDTAAANKAKGQADADVAAGPGGVADYAQARGNLANAYTNLQGLGNTGGLQDQIQSQYHVGPGQAGFDAALLGSSPQKTALSSAASGFAGLNSYLDDQANAAAQRPMPTSKPHTAPTDVDPTDPTTPGRRHYDTEDAPRRPQGGGL